MYSTPVVHDNSTAMMDTPDNPLLKNIADYWGWIATGLGAVIALWGYVKLLHGKSKQFGEWWQKLIDAPNAIAMMRREMLLESGLTLREWIAIADDELKGIRQIVKFETISRRTLWDSTDSPMFEAGLDGKFMWANRAFLKACDCTLDAIKGENWQNIVAGPDREEVLDGWHVAIMKQIDFKAKFRLATDNEEKWVRFSVICHKDDSGTALRLTGKMWEIPDPRGHGTHTTID